LRGGGARMNLQMAAGSCIRRSGRYGVPNDFRRERSKRRRQPFRKSGHDSFAECRRERSWQSQQPLFSRRSQVYRADRPRFCTWLASKQDRGPVV